MRLLVVVFSVSGALVAGCSAATPALTVEPSPGTLATSRTSHEPRPSSTAARPESLAYVPLGDSYTIGTSVPAEDRWPNQLVRALEPEIELRLVENMGVNGYTSADLLAAELPQMASLDVDLVSVLIGVNDVVQGVPAMEYRQNVATILEDLGRRVTAGRIFIVSTPDYTLTPEGGSYGEPARQSQRIRRFNEIMAEEASSRDLPYVDIGPVAERVRDDASLVADDGLHPSGKQYAGWVELIAPVVRDMIDERPPR